MYSLGIERVACVLAQEIDLPVPDVYIELVDGEDGIVSTLVPGNPWAMVDDEQFDHVTMADRDQWTVYAAFDVLLANHDRHDENIFVHWNDPLRRKPVEGEQCALWLIDFGWSGLWPVYKFGENLRPGDLENLSPDADVRNEFAQGIRVNTPPRFRRGVALRGTEERAEALEILRGITDDAVREAVDDVRGSYMTERASDLTTAFICGRLDRIDTLMSSVYPL